MNNAKNGENMRFNTDTTLLDTALQKQVFKQIKDYNENIFRRDKDRIKFMHGGSSAALIMMKKKVKVEVAVERNGQKEIIDKTMEIPLSLIPTGLLRKRYGIYPLSGELDAGSFAFGKRKNGFNYNHISGMEPSEEGVGIVTGYAENFSEVFVNPTIIQQNIEQLIITMDSHRYIRNLKMLVMQVSNLMVLDPNSTQLADRYLSMLDAEYNVLKKEGCCEGEFDRLFTKYFSEIAARLKGKKYAYVSDPAFVDAITSQYPVIYCFSVKGKQMPSSDLRESLYEGELPLSTLKMVFTPHENVAKLNELLKNHGLNVEVKGYAPKPKQDKEKAMEGGVKALDEAKSTDEARQIIESLPAGSAVLLESLNNLAKSYLNSGDENKFNIMMWILKNCTFRDSWALVHTKASLFDDQNRKLLIDPSYLERCGHDSLIQYERLKRVHYLEALFECAAQPLRVGIKIKRIDPVFFDYDKDISSNNVKLLSEYVAGRERALSKLVYLLAVLMSDKDNRAIVTSATISALIDARISGVSQLINEIFTSLLANSTKGALRNLLEQMDLAKPYIGNTELFKQLLSQLTKHIDKNKPDIDYANKELLNALFSSSPAQDKAKVYSLMDKIDQYDRRISQEEFIKTKQVIMDAIDQWLIKARNNSLDFDSHFFYSFDNDKRRAPELCKEFAKINNHLTLTNRLAEFMVMGKVASDGPGEFSRFDVRNSLNNVLSKQFFPEAFLPADKNSKKDIFATVHTRNGASAFMGRTELAYTTEELAKILATVLFPSIKEQVSQVVPSKKGTRSITSESQVISRSTFFKPKDDQSGCKSGDGKKRESSPPSMRKGLGDEDS